MVKETENESRFRFVIYFAIGITLLKISLIPFLQITDSDAVSRIYLSQAWASHPHLITQSVWGPLHFYLNGFVLMFWDDPILAPSVLNILLSTVTLFPFYFFTKRLFNPDGALVATLFLGVSPILFRNSFLCLSETPYLLFLSMALDFISKSIIEKKTRWAVLGGLAISIAAGFRYEAWLLIVLFCFVFACTSSFRKSLVFGITASVFPVYWLISNKLHTGDAFFSINGNYRWTIEMMGNNENLDFESHLRRIWYFPFSWMIAVGPFTGWFVLKRIRATWKSGHVRSLPFLFSVLALVFLFIMLYNAFNGTLLLQHRFIGTLVLFTLPFIADHFMVITRKSLGQAAFLGASAVLLSFVYNTSGVKPLPRLKNQESAEIVAAFQPRLSGSSALILDFISWEGTYYCALMSRLPQHQIAIVDGARHSVLPLEAIRSLLSTSSHCILILKNDSPLYQEILPELQKKSDSGEIGLRSFYTTHDIVCMEYKRGLSASMRID